MPSPEKPLFNVGETVYLVESAKLGHMEYYRVSGITLDVNTNGWLYQIHISPSADGRFAGDSNRLRPAPYDIWFTEFELCEYCVAVSWAILYHQNMLQTLITKHDELCGSSSEG